MKLFFSTAPCRNSVAVVFNLVTASVRPIAKRLVSPFTLMPAVKLLDFGVSNSRTPLKSIENLRIVGAVFL